VGIKTWGGNDKELCDPGSVQQLQQQQQTQQQHVFTGEKYLIDLYESVVVMVLSVTFTIL